MTGWTEYRLSPLAGHLCSSLIEASLYLFAGWYYLPFPVNIWICQPVLWLGELVYQVAIATKMLCNNHKMAVVYDTEHLLLLLFHVKWLASRLCQCSLGPFTCLEVWWAINWSRYRYRAIWKCDLIYIKHSIHWTVCFWSGMSSLWLTVRFRAGACVLLTPIHPIVPLIGPF